MRVTKEGPSNAQQIIIPMGVTGIKLVSVIVPCYNEVGNINRTFDELLAVAANHHYRFEIIAINDGSIDDTWDVIQSYVHGHSEIVGINQMANFGQSAAYQAGFDQAVGEYVITVSADLEIPVENIVRIIELLDAGYDFVNTHRVERWGGAKDIRQAKSGMANRIIRAISGVNIADRGSGMKGFRKLVADQLKLYGDMHRFIPDYLSLYGAKATEFDVEFQDRDYGESAYKNSSRAMKVILDLLTLSFMLSFARKPFNMMPGRLFGFTGVIIACAGGAIGLYLTALKIMGENIGGRPLLIAAVLMIIVGFQSLMMGLLGELVLRIYFESSGRKTYTTREIIL
jgi:glycosyltransferase involved in cell wall biosynthesis